MRRSLPLALTIFLAAGGSAAGAASAHMTTRPRCGPGYERPWVADSKAEVYFAREPIIERRTHAVRGSEAVYRGCVYGSTRSFKLGATGEGGESTFVGIEHITLSGATVAYDESAVASRPEGDEQGYFYVVVRDLRTGKRLEYVPTGVPLYSDPRHVGVGSVEAIVLQSDGAVAWIAFDEKRSELLRASTGHEDFYYDLYALDKTGERLLASGTELDPYSLALTGSTLYWSEAGKPFSSTLE